MKYAWISFILQSFSYSNADILVRTSLGLISGIEESFNSIGIHSFLGIPFAKPPLGERRFKSPEMIDPWPGVLYAHKPANTCFYTTDQMFPGFRGAEMWNPPTTSPQTEDCLQMNIWVPENSDGSVLVWIYGGGFYSGSASLELYDGKVLAAMTNKIVVNINYRLGPFGFLFLDNQSDITGNMGLLDQQMALRWIYSNIRSFGGDPTTVTLWGESAGSASVTSHLFAPGSEKYFNKIIANSGSITNSWATQSAKQLRETTIQLAKSLNCTDGEMVDNYAIAKCLRTIETSKFQLHADLLSPTLPISFAFTPIEEDPKFFKGNVFKKLSNLDFKKDISVLIGTMEDEGTYFLPYYLAAPEYGFAFNYSIQRDSLENKALINKTQFKDSVGLFMPYFSNSPLIENALLHTYSEVSTARSPGEKLRNGIARFVGDKFVVCDTMGMADILSENIYGSVYSYRFTMRSSANAWPSWMGVMHGYELEYIFGQPFSRPQLYDTNIIEIEKAFSTKIMNLISNFSTSSVPDPKWTRYNRIERKTNILSEEIIEGNIIVEELAEQQCSLLKESTDLVEKMKTERCEL